MQKNRTPVLFLLLAVFGLILARDAEGAIRFTDLMPDKVLGTPGQEIPIDIDNNGVTDFIFFYDLYEGGAYMHINTPENLRSSNKVMATGQRNVYGRDEVLALTAGAPINAARVFSGSVTGNGPLVAQPAAGGRDLFEGLGDRYVGVRFARNGANHFGWIRIDVPADGSTVTIKSYAYEDVADKAIAAGAEAEVAVQQIVVMSETGELTIDEPTGSLNMVANIIPENATIRGVTWSIDNENIASINATGLLRAFGDGEVVVTATAQDGSGVTGSATVTLTNQSLLIQEITVRGDGDVLAIDTAMGTLQMIADIFPGNATNPNVDWSVDDESVAIIDTTGLLRALKNGTVVVTATAQDASGVSGTATVEITNQTATIVLVQEIFVSSATGEIEIGAPGGTLQMMAEILPENATNQNVDWAVDDTTVATINSVGLLKAKSNGVVIVTATARDGSGIEGFTSITVVNQSTTGVDSDASLGSLDLTLSPMPANDRLRIAFNGTGESNVVLSNAIGEVVRQVTIWSASGLYDVDLSGIPSGHYVLLFRNGGQTISRGLIVAGNRN